jgi:uncharacterized protein with ATP-grasp and redox domains
MAASASRPAAVRTNTSNAFAHHTMQVRVPAIIREVQTLNADYPPDIQRNLDVLRESIQADGPIPMLDLPAPDYDDWASAYASHRGETWQATEWFFAETFAYRHVIQAVRWWETGRDPFAPKKALELASESLWQTLDQALAVRERRDLSVDERLAAMLELALWGNRIDLSYAVAAAHGSHRADDDLLVDDRNGAVARLLRAPGTVHLLTDNAGTELAMDMALADLLLDGIADRVIFHLKLHPTFVSDAVVPDVLAFLERLEASGDPARRLADRLRAAFDVGRWRLAPDGYWNSSRFLWAMPPHLAQMLHGAHLVIVKGDANYRRLVGDALWPPETPLGEVAAYFPAPLLALRSLKSDTIVGLPEGLAARLDAVDEAWRSNGKRGLIQFVER